MSQKSFLFMNQRLSAHNEGPLNLAYTQYANDSIPQQFMKCLQARNISFFCLCCIDLITNWEAEEDHEKQLVRRHAVLVLFVIEWG